MDNRKHNKGTKGNKGGRPSKSDEQKLIEGVKSGNSILVSPGPAWFVAEFFDAEQLCH